MGLVGIVQPGAESFAPGIEHHGQMCAGVILHQPCHHVAEAKDGIHMHAIRSLHIRYGVEGPENKARAVDEDEPQWPESAPSPSSTYTREQ